MTPLVRGALALREAARRCTATLLAVPVALVVVETARAPKLGPLVLAAGGLSLALVLGRLWRRLRSLDAGESHRLDFELFTHLALLVHLAVAFAPGGFEGPWGPALYLLVMLAAGFSRPLTTLALLVCIGLLQFGLERFAFGREDLNRLLPRFALLAAFGSLNLLVFRSEIARVRTLARRRIDAEIQRMREAARSYRLVSAPAGPVSLGVRSTEAPGAEERALRSGVDEIHEAMQLSLDLLRRALSARSAVLLWGSGPGGALRLQEASSEVDVLAPGPFDNRDGLLAAAVARGAPVAIAGGAAARHVPYYPAPLPVAAVAAVPVLEHGNTRGLLLVDRAAGPGFSEAEQELLAEAARFLVRVMENERVFLQLERAKSEQGKLYRAAERLAQVSTAAEVVEAGVASAREIALFDLAAVTLFDRAAGEHEICAASGEGTAALVGQRFRHNTGLVSMVVQNKHPLPWRGDYDPARQVVFARRLEIPPEVASLLVLPLLVHDRALGTLVLGSRKRGAFGDAVRQLLELLASHIAVSLAHARMVARLEDLATTDGLTGLLNKRALLELAERKLRAAERFRKPLSVLVCDIDFFKKVNDQHGHDVGDLVIKGFAGVLSRVKRDTDSVGRFGGEEFVLVCEETDSRGAFLLAERIRTELEAVTFQTPAGPLRVTCSVGVATAPQAGTTWEPLFKATDEALYASKRGGRNRVTVWAPRLSEVSRAGGAAA